MRFSQNLALSCGANHLCAAQLRMNASGRCDLIEGHVELVPFYSNDALLWLKALSERFEPVGRGFREDASVGFVLPGNLTLTKHLRLEQASAQKRERLIAFEARQNIPYPINEVAWDHALIAERADEFDVMIGAARLEIVEALSRYAKEAKLDPLYIETSATALANGFRFNYPELRDDVLMVSVGAKSTDIVFIGGTRVYSRNVPFGGAMLTADMAESLQLPAQEAEAAKLACIAGELVPGEVADVFAASSLRFLDRLGSEIDRTRALMLRQGFDFKSTRCFVTGGGSILPEIGAQLERRIGLPTQAYDALRKINVERQSLKEEMTRNVAFLADAIGAAVSCFLPDARRINLLPESIRWRRAFKRQQPFYVTAALVACAAIALPALNSTLRIRSYEEEIRSLDGLIAPLSRLNSEIFEKNAETEKLREVIDAGTDLSAVRSNWIRLLNDLQARMSAVEDVWLDRMRLERVPDVLPGGRGHARLQGKQQNVELKIQGRFIDVENPMSTVSEESYQRLIALLDNFESSEFVADLKDERFDNSIPGILRFDFTLVVEADARL